MTTDNIKQLSEKLSKLYGVDAHNGLVKELGRWLAEDSGRVADLADEHGVSAILGKYSANAFDDNMFKHDFYEKYSDHSSKATAARMARVKCLIAIKGE